MPEIAPQQLKCLNTLVSKLHIDKESKQVMVSGYSEGRASSSKDLSYDEAAAMIKHLKSMDPQEAAADKMRKKIISMAREMGWSSPPAPQGGVRKADMKRIDDWCRKYSPIKKSLDNHTYNQLPALVSQFEKVYKHYLSSL